MRGGRGGVAPEVAGDIVEHVERGTEGRGGVAQAGVEGGLQAAQGGLEALTQLTPVGLVVAVLVGKDAVGDFAGTPASELGQQRLFFRRGLTAFGGDLLDQLNNADVLLGSGLPTAGALQLSGSNSVI